MKWVKAEEQRATRLPSPPSFLLLCLLHFLSVNEAQSSQEHKPWDLSSYHRLVRLPGSTLCYSLMLQPLCPSLSAHLSEFEVSFGFFIFLFFKTPLFFSSHPAFWLLLSTFFLITFLSLLLFFSLSVCCSCHRGSERTSSGQISFSVYKHPLKVLCAVFPSEYAYCKTMPTKTHCKWFDIQMMLIVLTTAWELSNHRNAIFMGWFP